MLSDFSAAVENAQKLDPQLLLLCRQRVSLAAQQQRFKPITLSETELTARVAAIIAHNIVSKRATWSITHQRPSRPQASDSADAIKELIQDASHQPELANYIDRVILHYLREHARISSLIAFGEQAWADLHHQLARRAYNLLRRIGLSRERAGYEANDFAQETCAIVFRTHFPFDVPFEAWATRILSNHILRQYIRSQDVGDRAIDSLSLDNATEDLSADERYSDLMEQLENPSSSSNLEQVEAREQLRNAIAALDSMAQQQVIIGTFFYDLSDEDLALHLNKSVGAIYILRHRALKRLRSFLEGFEEDGN